MSGSNCNMGGCKSYNAQNLSKSFFRFPKEYERCKLWVEKCNQARLVDILKTFGPLYMYNNNRLCSDHFLDSDYRNPRQKSQGLKPDVVPSVNLAKPAKRGKGKIRSKKHCSFNGCSSNSMDYGEPHMKDVFFVPFAKFDNNPMKCERWVRACGRRYFSIYGVKKHTYICSKHFVGGRGPTKEHPDPVPYDEDTSQTSEFCLEIPCDPSYLESNFVEELPNSDTSHFERNSDEGSYAITRSHNNLKRNSAICNPRITKVESVTSSQDFEQSLHSHSRHRISKEVIPTQLEKTFGTVKGYSKAEDKHTHDLSVTDVTWSWGQQRNYSKNLGSSNTTYLEIVSTCCKNCSSPLDGREVGVKIKGLKDLHQEVTFENLLGWAYLYNDSVLDLYKIIHGVLLISLSIDGNLNISVKVFNQPVSLNHPVYRTLPKVIEEYGDVIKILQNLNSWNVCNGYNDNRCTELSTKLLVSEMYIWQTESLHSNHCEFLFKNSSCERCVPCQQLCTHLNTNLSRIKEIS